MKIKKMLYALLLLNGINMTVFVQASLSSVQHPGSLSDQLDRSHEENSMKPEELTEKQAADSVQPEALNSEYFEKSFYRNYFYDDLSKEKMLDFQENRQERDRLYQLRKQEAEKKDLIQKQLNEKREQNIAQREQNIAQGAAQKNIQERDRFYQLRKQEAEIQKQLNEKREQNIAQRTAQKNIQKSEKIYQLKKQEAEKKDLIQKQINEIRERYALQQVV